jgi:HD superfamily phosphohydrolase
MLDVPELFATSSIRISPELDVPVTPRIKRIIDTSVFRRLARISQLGLVSMVYPGATHSRFEHSLGVYRNAVHYVQQLKTDPVFSNKVNTQGVERFLLAALLHDIGHWPFCHLIEDLGLPGIPHHEELAHKLIAHSELAECLQEDWHLEPKDIASLIAPTQKESVDDCDRILRSMLSGPIDVDKLDYLERDSLHAGVPYGRNFDRYRLVRSLCIHPETFRLSLSEKGKTAAEMMVFARYVMFSEVYWHHAVRSATAMLQRTVFELSHEWGIFETHNWIEMHESKMMDELMRFSQHRPWFDCVDGLFGSHRRLYKRAAEYDCFHFPDLQASLARRPYAEIVAISRELSKALSLGDSEDAPCILIDAPPPSLEIQSQIDVRLRDGSFQPLGRVSPIVYALATRQFDELVKRVRVFVAPKFMNLRDANGSEVITEKLLQVTKFT